MDGLLSAGFGVGVDGLLSVGLGFVGVGLSFLGVSFGFGLLLYFLSGFVVLILSSFGFVGSFGFGNIFGFLSPGLVG